MDFASLQHMKDRRSTVRGFCLPATFRPQGLITLSAVSSLRSRAGFVSRQQRSWDSPFEAFSSRKVSGRYRPEAPTYRFSRLLSRRRSVGPVHGPRFLGFDPCRSPSRPNVCLARQPPDAPLGFALPGPANERLDQDFAQSPLSCFATKATHAPAAGTSEYLSTPVWSGPLAMQAQRVDTTTHLGFPHRPNPCRSNEPPSGP
jgi:hypothetical protein